MQDNLERYTNEMFRAENTHDALARYEKKINEDRAKRENEMRAEDRQMREKLEKQSSSNYARRSLVDILNFGSISERALDGGLEVITKLREDQQKYGYKTGADHNRTLAKLEAQGESFNKLDPGSLLARAGASRGAYHEAPSAYNFGGDPGNVRGSNYEPNEPGGARGRAEPVRDADGSLRSGDARARDHFSSGEMDSIVADLKWLLANTKRPIEIVNSRQYPRGKV